MTSITIYRRNLLRIRGTFSDFQTRANTDAEICICINKFKRLGMKQVQNNFEETDKAQQNHTTDILIIMRD